MTESLYIHIPFCVRKCIYCDFLSVPYDHAFAERYVAAACKELDKKAGATAALRTVYVGGGTPSLLPPDALRKLFGRIRDSFSIADGAEITIEANPGAFTSQTLDAVLSLGVTRISLGVQSFNDDELRTLGRIHTSADVLRSVELIRKAGIEDYSVDLMYGLPGQTMEAWRGTLDRVLEHRPPHISAYELTPATGTPLFDRLESGLLKMPDEGLVLDMFGETSTRLSTSGYCHYEISNYALPGRVCTHNMNYWDRGEYLGVGAGAHSFTKGARSKNTDDVEAYVDCIEADRDAGTEPCLSTPSEAGREFLFLGLRKTAGVLLADAEALELDIVGGCADLIRDGYLAADGRSARLTRKGLPVSNTILVSMFEQLGL